MIQKELERIKEEYDAAVKRDKEIERQFKKEFHTGDFMFEQLFKLFRKRDVLVCTYSPVNISILIYYYVY
jgi:hypothetical protein